MLAVVLSMALLSAAGDAKAKERVLQGEMLVRTHCGRCHATGESGRSPNRAAPPMRELHNRYSLDNLAMALSEGMLRGHPAMPKFDFTQGEIDAIMSYLRSIQTNQSASRGAAPRGAGS
jgi:mono/diheme cytochrome c family protein